MGAHLANAAAAGDVRRSTTGASATARWTSWCGRAQRLTAIEVKSGRAPQAHPGIAAFQAAFKPHRTLLVGGGGLTIKEFLARPVAHWVEA